jgi:predicted transcriptional regulator
MKQTTHRGRIMIVHDILELCLVPQKKTHVLQKANLSSAQSEHYLNILFEKGLLESEMQEHANDHGYQPYLSTTQKGREALQTLTGVLGVADSIFATGMLQKMKS